jgi:hypothetical protein
MVVFASKILRNTGSWIVGVLAISGSLWYMIGKYKDEKRK